MTTKQDVHNTIEQLISVADKTDIHYVVHRQGDKDDNRFLTPTHYIWMDNTKPSGQLHTTIVLIPNTYNNPYERDYVSQSNYESLLNHFGELYGTHLIDIRYQNTDQRAVVLDKNIDKELRETYVELLNAVISMYDYLVLDDDHFLNYIIEREGIDWEDYGRWNTRNAMKRAGWVDAREDTWDTVRESQDSKFDNAYRAALEALNEYTYTDFDGTIFPCSNAIIERVASALGLAKVAV